MIDKLTLERIQSAHPEVRDELYCLYNEICDVITSPYVKVRFSDVLRTKERQNQLHKIGRSLPGRKVTWVKGGYSFHNYGLAVDIVLLIDKDKNGTFETASWDVAFDGDNDSIADWLECVKIFNFYGWQWGLINSRGKRYDLPHFQKTFGFKASQLKRMEMDTEGYPILFPKQ
jgi:peptidoglycan L-alanyl-D-glutamate endopeptidase CwlK